MPLTPRLRKLALTAHVTASVGWLGAVLAFLALSVAGLTSQNPQTVQGAYLVMELTGWAILVPLSLASLLTGLVCSLGSTWGLFRHYWVLFKLAINPVRAAQTTTAPGARTLVAAIPLGQLRLTTSTCQHPTQNESAPVAQPARKPGSCPASAPEYLVEA